MPAPLFVLLALTLGLLVPTTATHAASVLVHSIDGPNVGLHDQTPVAPVGGNPGVTLGLQRLHALQYAADLWGAALASDVTIMVEASFQGLTCNESSAALAGALARTAHRDFAGTPSKDTWFPQALANRLAGTDLAPHDSDILTIFNSSLGVSCPFPRSWYYGLDAAADPNEIDLVTVALHEIAHGLGFATFLDPAQGARLGNRNDVMLLRLEDHSRTKLLANMDADGLEDAAIDTGDLHSVGPHVVAAGAALTAGREPVSGHVEIYAPAVVRPGSSVSHFSTSLEPDALMEPFYTGPTHDLTLSLALLHDLGWTDDQSPCGNGLFDPLEECDDGNGIAGDCCSGFCLEEPAGQSCDDGDPCTLLGACDVSGNCVSAAPEPCGDQRICTIGSCTPGVGCSQAPTGDVCRDDNQINTFVAAEQRDVAITADAAGNVTVVWTSENGQDGDAEGVFGQRLDGNGVPLGGEFQVNTTVDDLQTDPAVCAWPTGEFVVAWTSRPSGALNGAEVVAQLYDANGTPVGGEFQLNTHLPDHQGFFDGPEVACWDTGFAAVWTSSGAQDGSHEGVFGRRFDRTGQPLGPEFQANTYTLDAQGRGRVDIAADPTGNLVVVWPSGCDGGVSVSCPAGGPWQDGSYAGVYGQRYDTTGQPAGPEFQVHTTTGGVQGTDGLDVAMGPGGESAVVWTGVGQGRAILGQRFDASGAASGPELRINTHEEGRQWFPRAAFTPTGDLLVVWEDASGADGGFRIDIPLLFPFQPAKLVFGGDAIFGQWFRPDGTPLGDEFRINTGISGSQERPALVATPAGNVHVAWAGVKGDNPFASGSEIFGTVLVPAPASCPAEPRDACIPATKGRVVLNTPASGAKLKWQWTGGGTLFDFDRLGGMHGYTVCVYEGAGLPSLLAETAVPPYADCGLVPCWKEQGKRRVALDGLTPIFKGKRRLKYRDRLTASGITSFQIKERNPNAEVMQVKLKAAGVSAARPEPASGPVTVQLAVNNGRCWETHFPTGKTTTKRFTARLP